MAATGTPDPELREALVRGIDSYERRRRRRLVGGGAVVVAAAAIVGGLSWAGDGTEPESGTATNPSIETGDTSVPSTTLGSADGRVEVEVIDPLAPAGTDLVGTDLVLLATNGNGGGVAIADLATNRRAVVPDATRSIDGFSGGAISAGLVTDRHVWFGPPASAIVAPGGGPIDAILGGALDRPRSLEVDGPIVRRAVATEDGDGVWLYSSGDPLQTSLRLLDADLDTVVEVGIPGGLLVDVAGDEAVVDLSLPEGDGGVLLVSPDGSTRELERPAGASFVTATTEHTIWSRPTVRPTELVIVDADGAQRTVAAPGGRTWTQVAHPTIPSDSAGLKSVTSDGTTLLLGLFDADDGENGEITDLSTIDLVRGELVERFPLETWGAAGDLSAAFWSVDDSRIVAVVGMAEGQGVMWTEPGSGLVQGLGDVFPPGYFVIAAR